MKAAQGFHALRVSMMCHPYFLKFYCAVFPMWILVSVKCLNVSYGLVKWIVVSMFLKTHGIDLSIVWKHAMFPMTCGIHLLHLLSIALIHVVLLCYQGLNDLITHFSESLSLSRSFDV